MSITLGTRSKSTAKAVCPKCNFAVHVFVIDGVKVFADAELITVIPIHGDPVKVHARRSHEESCLLNRARNERLKAKSKRPT